MTEQVDFNPHDIIFDPNVLAVATGIEEHDNYVFEDLRGNGRQPKERWTYVFTNADYDAAEATPFPRVTSILSK